MRTAHLLFIAAILLAAVPSGRAAADPEADYLLHCRGCHGPDGAGAPGGVPAFGGQLGKFLSVPGGREFLVRVPGSAQAPLDDARLATLLTWMLRTFSANDLPPGFAGYTGAEVARVRRPLTDVSGTRSRLIDAIAAAESRTASAGTSP